MAGWLIAAVERLPPRARRIVLTETAGEVDRDCSCEEQPRDAGEWTQDALLRFFLTMAYRHDVLAVVCDSPTGRKALTTEYFAQHAAQQISHARRWVGQVTLHMPPEAAGAAVTALLMAQGFFLASHGAVSSSAELFPDRRLLRACLLEGHTHEWLVDQDAELPQWLTEHDD